MSGRLRLETGSKHCKIGKIMQRKGDKMDIKGMRDKWQYRRPVPEDLPDFSTFGEHKCSKVLSLRYGENPPAYEDEGGAALYRDPESSGPRIPAAEKLHGKKELGYNNIVDADAGLRLAVRLTQLFPNDTIAVLIKHKGPCGVARSSTLAGAQQLAYLCDSLSAFGGVNIYNRTVDAPTAELITSYFNEVVVAPDYTDEAMDILRRKENLRVLRVEAFSDPLIDTGIDGTRILGGEVVQKRMISHIDSWENFEKVSSGRDPTPDELEAALFNWAVALRTPSNAVIVGTSYRTVGIGRGQPSRVDSTRLAIYYANNRCEGSNSQGAVMVSDAFFPKPDSIELAAEARVSVIVAPLGSDEDERVIRKADDHGIVFLCTRPIPGTNKVERGFSH